MALTILAQMETNQVEESPVIVRTTSSASRHRTRKKSCDTSDFLQQAPDIQTKYYHKEIWTDENGNIFRGKKPVNNNECIDDKDKTKKILLFEIKIKRISAIDTTSETFRCRFHYYLTWLASKSEYDSYLLDSDNYIPSWIPKIELTNAAEIHKHIRGSNYSIKSNKSVGFNDEWRISRNYLGFDPFYGKWNRVRFEGDITFAEELELESFPFDCQDLSLYIKVEKDNIELCDVVLTITGDSST